MADSGRFGDCTLLPVRGWFGSMEASKVVPACHDILVFGLCSRCRSADGCCEVGQFEALQIHEGLEDCPIFGDSDARGMVGFLLQGGESYACLGEHGGVRAGDFMSRLSEGTARKLST